VRKSDAAPQIEPRAHPVGRAIAVYGVVPADAAGRKFVVDGKRTVVVRWGNVGLVTGYVDPVEFSPGEIERRRTDRKWLRERARHHERVLERLGPEVSVLPAALLTAYEGPASLEEAVRKRGARWRTALRRVAGKSEYALHVFAGPHAPGEPEPYVLRVSARARREKRGAVREEAQEQSPVEAHVARLWDACVAAADDARRFDAPGLRGFALGAALLVDDAAAAELQLGLSNLTSEGRELGLTVYLEGPRLPYTFG
jgi:hypothetical protein